MKQGENPLHISGSRIDAERALTEARGWMRPLPDAALRQELVALHLKTVSRKGTEIDLNLRLEVFLKELSAFPGDVVRDCLRHWPDKFFPAWAELREAIAADRRIRERRQRIGALERFLIGAQDTERQGPPPTDEQVERMRKHFAPNWAPEVSGETKARLAEVDRVHGPAAKAKTSTTFNRLGQRGE